MVELGKVVEGVSDDRVRDRRFGKKGGGLYSGPQTSSLGELRDPGEAAPKSVAEGAFLVGGTRRGIVGPIRWAEGGLRGSMSTKKGKRQIPHP